MRLDGLTVIVTGAARGIGHAISLGLAQLGAQVAMVDITTAKAAAVAGNGRVLPIIADITRDTDVQRIFDTVQTQLGTPRALVNNAAIGRGTIRADFMSSPIKLWEITPDQWRRIVDVNVNGFFLMTRAVMPLLLKAGWGRVVTVTTSLDTMIRGGSATYGGSKAAIEAYMATLAEDLQGTRVTANVLLPGGPVNTPMIPDVWKVDRAALIQPEIMTPPLAWLLSTQADDVSGRRLIAARWTAGNRGEPIAWPQLCGEAILPSPASAL